MQSGLDFLACDDPHVLPQLSHALAHVTHADARVQAGAEISNRNMIRPSMR